MPPRQWRLFVADIVDAIEAIEGYSSGLTQEQFFGDRLRLDAVMKNLTVVGEAAGRVPNEVVDANPQIPWPKMRAMRNVIVHEYFGIDEEVLWGTIADDLKPLLPLLAALLAKHDIAG
jgi:uncharacterized protein with HEPN domain